MGKKKRKSTSRGRKRTQKPSYEGTQYRGGRSKDIKNLVKVEGGFINQHGVFFTTEQRKELERAVNRSNYRRKKQVAEWEKDQPGATQLLLMSKKGTDWIVSRQSKGLQGFKSMEEYEDFMTKQERIQSGEYLHDRMALYKENYIIALRNAFDDEAEDVVKAVEDMTLDEYIEFVKKDEFREIGYMYNPDERAGRLQQIRRTFGLAPAEDYIEPK